MKLSKKLIAALVTIAMVIAQVSVLPFAETGAANPYVTDHDDGAYYFWRVPNTQKDGSELPKNTAGRTYAPASAFGISGFSGSIGMNPETLEYTSSSSGAVFVENFDGENMVEVDLKDGNQGCYTFSFGNKSIYNGAKYYPDKGLPEGVDNKLEAFAIRFKTTGEGASSFEIRIPEGPIYGMMRNFSEYVFIDAKTNERSIIHYGNPETGKGTSYFLKGEMDGWIIVPFEAAFKAGGYTEAKKAEIAEWFKTSWTGMTIYTHGLNCSNHSASWSNWDNRKLYFGDCMLLTDIEKFIDARAAAPAPELEIKYDDSIKVKKERGVVYSIAAKDAPETILATNETGEFTGLKETTEYIVSAAWKDNHNSYKSYRTYMTDLSNPPLDTPVLIEGSLEARSFKVETIPGLQYTILDSGIWNEDGIFTELNPGTTYTVFARNKKTQEKTGNLIVKTPLMENPYDRGDGTSTMFEVPKEGDTYKNSNISKNTFVKDENGEVPIVESYGDRLIQLTPKPDASRKQNVTIHTGKAAWKQDQGVPYEIWLENFWGYAIRLKVDAGPEDMYFYLRMMFAEAHAYGDGWVYYTIDKATGTWQKCVKNGQWYIQDFDGWIVLPFNSFFKSKTFSYSYMQKNLKSFQFYLNGGASNPDTVNWADVPAKIYLGDAVIIEDMQKFIDTYAPNTEEPFFPAPRNKVTDPSIPAIMANDCSGNIVGDGLISFEKVRANVVEVKKPNEKSEALHLSIAYGSSNIVITDDAFNYDVIPPEVSNRTSDSTGFAFYLEVPETNKGRMHFGVDVVDDGDEHHTFGSTFDYFTISNGVVTQKFGTPEFKPGFKGYVMLPFLNFDYLPTISENVDGMINSPQTISSIGFSFDADTYPDIAQQVIIVDDIMLYQSFDEFTSAIVKIQGGKDNTVVVDEKTFQIDLNPEFPRVMANDCTGIEEEDGIYAIDGLYLTLIDRVGVNDSYVDVTIGKDITSVMFENHATLDELSDEDVAALQASTGISFDISIPEDALMTVGTDLEISEADSEIFLYDPNKFYYTVEDGEVYKVYGYLEFEPGFNGTVIVPFENFAFDEEYSEFWDGMLTFFEDIDYFGFYFSTDYYASIEDTTVSIDNISFYQEKYEYINAVWEKQTGKGTINPKLKAAGPEIQVVNTVSPETSDATPIVAVAGLLAVSAAAVALTRKKKED